MKYKQSIITFFVILSCIAAFLLVIKPKKGDKTELRLGRWSMEIKRVNKKRNPFNTGFSKTEMEFYANDFDVTFAKVPGVETAKVAGFYFSEEGLIKVIEQDDRNIFEKLFSPF